MNGNHAVKSAKRVLDIFELLSKQDKPLTLTEMSNELGIPISSMYGLINTLSSRRYLMKDEASQSYRLGPAILSLYANSHNSLNLLNLSDHVIEEVSRESGESVSLATLDGQDVIFISKKVSNEIIQVVNPVGTRLPAHSTGLGKCILANLSVDQIFSLYPEENLQAKTKNTLKTRTELLDTLKNVKIAGVAYDREESVIGVFAIASPILDHNGTAIASISIAAPISRVSKIKIKKWEELIKSGALQISKQLGYKP